MQQKMDKTIFDSPMTRTQWYSSALVAFVLSFNCMPPSTYWVRGSWVRPSSSSTRNKSRIRPMPSSFSLSPSPTLLSFDLLQMGGYYNEPEDLIDQSQTHMVFGLRCIETSVVACSESGDMSSPKVVGVRGLQPIGEQEYGQLMVNHLLSHRRMSSSTSSMSLGTAVTPNGEIKYEYTDTLQYPQYQQQLQTNCHVVNTADWPRAKIVEIGSSSTGLFAYYCLGVETVVQCHTDPVRISVVEYAHLFLDNSENNQKNDQSQSTWQTHMIENQEMIPHQILHDADWIIFTLSDMDLLHQTVQQIVSIQSNGGAGGGGSSKQTKIIVPQNIVTESQLQYYQHNVCPDGVVMINGLG